VRVFVPSRKIGPRTLFVFAALLPLGKVAFEVLDVLVPSLLPFGEVTSVLLLGSLGLVLLAGREAAVRILVVVIVVVLVLVVAVVVVISHVAPPDLPAGSLSVGGQAAPSALNVRPSGA
jgi:hypothetical protein